VKFQKAKVVVNRFENLSAALSAVKIDRLNLAAELERDLKLPEEVKEVIEDHEQRVREIDTRIHELTREREELAGHMAVLKHKREQAEARAHSAKSLIGQKDREIEKIEKLLAPVKLEIDEAKKVVEEVRQKREAEKRAIEMTAHTMREQQKKVKEKDVTASVIPPGYTPESYAKKMVKEQRKKLGQNA
jgi:chromosome segregation ATPase